VRRALVWVVGLVYATAWFVQVVKDGSTLADGVLPGWEALRLALSPLWERDFGGSFLEASLSVGSGLSNLVFLAAWVRLVRRDAARTRAWSWALFAAAAVDTFWLFDAGGPPELRAGYWLWLSSFVLLGLQARVSRAGPRAAA
jgi:hypothetical protein